MGIPGLYKEIGPGERISLAKIAVEHLERTGRPFRLAIDFAIWSFQNQASQGGRNPALRTLYHRLLKLLSLSIQPLFVFDGPDKPALKRNAVVSLNEDHWATGEAKALLDIFGFSYHHAPGEAEAECAILQQNGIVDAVLSEDVDTLMFGCGYTLRNWSAEQSRANKRPTHVSVYTSDAVRARSGLDREGLILVALMSGGDYDTTGIPGCGYKTACEAAKAGFGKELCALNLHKEQELSLWRQNLQHELWTNEHKVFRQKHKTIILPDKFPDKTIFNYYKSPTVSDERDLDELKFSIRWDTRIDVPRLRDFVAKTFGWRGLQGAKRLIRGLAPSLLTQKLLAMHFRPETGGATLEAKELAEERLIKCVSGRRDHWDTDNCPELRVGFVPVDIVGLNLAEEHDEETSTASESLQDPQTYPTQDPETSDGESLNPPVSPRKPKAVYDPTRLERLWILESFVKLGTPLLAENWEEDLRDLKKLATMKAREKKALAKLHPQHGAMEKFVRVSKPRGNLAHETMFDQQNSQKALASPSSHDSNHGSNQNMMSDTFQSSKAPKKNTRQPRAAQKNPSVTAAVNPWSLAKRPSDTFHFQPQTRYSALGIYPPEEPELVKALSSSSNRVPQRSEPDSNNSGKDLTFPQEPMESSRPSNQGFENITVRSPRKAKTRNRTTRKTQYPDQVITRRESGNSVNHQTDQFESIQPTQALPAPLLEEVSKSPSISQSRVRRLIALRQSLEGTWKYLDPDERHLAKNVFEDVEILDLTGS